MKRNLLLLLLAVLFHSSQAGADDDPYAALFQQAEYWRENNRDDLAREALERILSSDPQQPRALYSLGMIALDTEDDEAFDDALRRLQASAPDARETRALSQARQRRDLDTRLLRDARQQAEAGESAAALRSYRALFENSSPPDDLALEYYQTMAAVPGEWAEAERGLRSLSRARPDDPAVAFAHARILTYHPPSRREGLRALENLWPQAPSADVREAWRQALLWLEESEANVPFFQRYLMTHGSDREVADRLARASRPDSGADRARGFAALEAQRDAEARAAFSRAVQRNPDDADAHGGLGLVQLGAGEFAAAQLSLQRAIRLAPDRAAQWRDAEASARFYARLEAAQRLAGDGDVSGALSRVAPLTREPGQRGDEARLVQGDLLLLAAQPEAAEGVFRELLDDNVVPDQARLGLVRSLLAQQRLAEAEGLLMGVSPAGREAFDDLSQERAAALRQAALQQQRRGDRDGARRSLQQAVALVPEDPWTRLELARLLDEQGRPAEARRVMMQMGDRQASAPGRQAIAMLALDQSRWDDALRILDGAEDDDSRALRRQAERGRRVVGVRYTLAHGESWRVRTLLDGLYNDPPTDSAELGDIALALYEADERRLALALIRRDLASGLTEESSSYINHAVVLSRAGHFDESEQLLLSLLARSEPAERPMLDALQRDLRLAEAERRRERGDLAGAYVVLTRALESAPESPPLLLALARLYEQGGMRKEAAQVRDYLLQQNTTDVPARDAAVGGALAAGDPRHARQLLDEWPREEDAGWLLLSARTDAQRGRKRHALRQARTARELELRQLGARQEGAEQWRPGAWNPFEQRRQRDVLRDERRNDMRERAERQVWLPGAARGERWQGESDLAIGWAERPWQSGSDTAPDWRGLASPPLRDTMPRSARLTEIDALVSELEVAVAPHTFTGVQLRRRSGESGLSALTEVSGELAVSVVPAGSGRLGVRMTPVHINAGRVGSSAQGRFASGAIGAGALAVDEALEGVQPLLDGITTIAFSYDAAEEALAAANASGTATPQEIQQLEAARDSALRAFESATARNLFFEVGIDLDRLPADQRAFVDSFLLDNFGTSDTSLVSSDLTEYLINSARLEQLVDDLRARATMVARAAQPAATQQQSGAGLALDWQAGQFSADIGLSPQGFEVDNVLGGVRWAPAITEDSRLVLTAQRRAVTDSLLSWSGITDRTSGQRWGGVVRTGGELMLTFDDGYLGLFGSLGGYRYTGHNVRDNAALQMTLGSYLRPVNDNTHTTQIGVTVNYLGFDRNLGYFTFGHGGYFSPQDYVSLAIPVSYTRRVGDLSWTVSAAPGFQSYSQDDAPFFPTRADDQRWMDILATAGVIAQPGYAAASESGMGITVGGGLDYKLAPGLALGAHLQHDTFGEYAETSARIQLRYTGGY